MKNKKGMLGNIISGLIVIIVGLSLIPTITQQVDLAMECNTTINETLLDVPLGSTDSFGGGGSGNFGGYDGEVKKSWDYNELSILKDRNESVFGNHCEMPDSMKSILGLVIIFFALGVMVAGVGIAVRGLSEPGVL